MKTIPNILMSALVILCGMLESTAEVLQDSCRAVDTPAAALTEQETADGWRSLFDGETFSGWHKYGGGPVGSAWKVEDGSMTLVPGEAEDWKTVSGGDIVTDDVFENFELSLEWKIAEAGNSGIFYLVDEAESYDAASDTGLEMQVLDSERHGDGQWPKHRAGDLYDLIEADARTECEVGDWNHVRIVKRDAHVEHWMNGNLLLTVDLWTDHWNALIAGSKFADWEGFGKSTRGRIGVQDHGDRVWYRNLRIKEL
ncbi:MAG TPA: DUF1080 domain-containing protein [Rhodothermales bacterium]|nr:DUF1080 domain-containing protein [Rhodothermales bacterium]